MAAASRAGRKLTENREKAETKSSEGTPLANIDPVAFQIYLKLSLMNTWSTEHLKSLKLRPNMLLNLLAICRRFGNSEAIKNVEAQAYEFIRSFHKFQAQSEFLKMSQSNLAIVVSSEDVLLTEMDLFECVCRWAEFQCKVIEKTRENMRGVIGAVLFEIRFPRMSSTEFAKVCRRDSNLLSPLEQLATQGFIEMDDQEKQKYDVSQLPFKTHARNEQKKIKKIFEGSTLCLTENQKIVDSPSFMSNGENENCNRFKISNGRIALHGIGFLGPIDEDSYFDVTVQIKRYINGSLAYKSVPKKKRIFARKRELFYFTFDEPITIEQSDDAAIVNHKDCYNVWFLLRGPNAMAVDRRFRVTGALEQNGITFHFQWWSGCKQFAEFLYKKL